MGGDASRNGAELFKIRADFSAKIVTFRLVGGDASPPLNPPLLADGAAVKIELRRVWNIDFLKWQISQVTIRCQMYVTHCSPSVLLVFGVFYKLNLNIFHFICGLD